jgi:uncharacterized protein (TIGR02996 family)
MAAIIANPDEDTPRLAFADWLQEHGDKHDQARAEFIRLQIEVARFPERNARWRRLERDAAKLERKHRAAWVSPLSEIAERLAASEYAPFERGLLARVVYNTLDFLRKPWQPALPGALAAVGVEELCLLTPSKRLGELAASEGVRWVSALSCESPDDEALTAFGQSPHFAHLRKLALEDAKVTTDAGLKAFARTGGLSQLRTVALTLSGGLLTRARGKYTTAGVLAILKSDRLPQLRTLDVSGEQPAKFDYRQLLADPILKRLTSFSVGTRAPMDAVVACPHLTNLRDLTATFVTFTNADAETLLGNPALANLKTLWLDGVNPSGGRLSRTFVRKLRERFGTGLTLVYDEE